jgi:hypothetical protein
MHSLAMEFPAEGNTGLERRGRRPNRAVMELAGLPQGMTMAGQV